MKRKKLLRKLKDFKYRQKFISSRRKKYKNRTNRNLIKLKNETYNLEY